ncbi:MAG: FkbM family methyltransferase [Prolixibacteraceae bacterium]|nr:FkbM family methyltransferase [Prolixibacteraceae bacterium]
MIIKSIGKVLRSRFPEIYKVINPVILRIKKKNHIFISDHFGKSFKEYISDNNMAILLKRLKENLDDYSIRTIDVIYQRILNYPELKYNQVVVPKKGNIVGGLLEEEKISFSTKKVKKTFNLKLKNSEIESSVFEFFHGITMLPVTVQNYLNDREFMDIGAYIGDSAIALQKYNYKKIYSVEMSQLSIAEYRKNMKRHLIEEGKYEIINYAVVEQEGIKPITIIDSGSAGLNVFEKNPYNFKEISVECKTLDFIVDTYQIKPAFIKMDIEGYAMDCIIGGLKSLKKFRPVLSIAIYHNPVEFFEVKPILEKELENYTFMIRKLSNTFVNNTCHAETILLAYPNEIG